MNTSPPPIPSGRAIVLGGGGSTGNAWLIGLVAGLLEAGVDVTDADLIVGTSAGSTAAAQLTGAAPDALLSAILDAPAGGGAGTPPGGRPPGGRPTAGPVAQHLDRLRAIIADAADPAEMRRALGAAAMERDAASDGSEQERWRATVAARLPQQEWPAQRILITAIDARTGEPVVFDRDSGVGLADAVAASCSNGFGVPAFRIGDGRYLDGGYRRNENADLAAGSGRVLVLSPFGGRSLHPEASGMQLAAQVDELRAGGSRVEIVAPDAEAEHLFGANAMDVRQRPAAARGGRDQGRALAGRLAAFWSSESE